MGTETLLASNLRQRKPKETTATSEQALTSEEILCLSVDEVLHKLNSSRIGLTEDNAQAALQEYGPNEVAKKRKRTSIVRFLLLFRNPLVIILIFAGIISGIVGEIVNALIIIAIVLLSVFLDFFQESKAGKAAEALKARVATTVTVFREGNRQEVMLSQAVPGDIVNLSAGDIVPADCRLITSKDFFVDQSALTGESFPVEKTALPIEPKCVPNTVEWTDYVFMGTSVVSGSATAVVVKTGNYTEYGKIVKRIVERRPETEFARGLRRFGYMIMQVTFLLVIFVFFINALYKRGVLDSLLFSVALAVGLTPELLPMIISINLSKGALAMSKKGVIVKELASIQNFGNMDVLCTDKTGTLTENRVTLVLHVDIDGNDDEKVLLYSFLNSHYQTGLKSPLDQAILAHAEMQTQIQSFEKVDEVPFDFARRRLSVVVEKKRQRYFISKGAPEEIIKVCAYYEHGRRFLDVTNEVRRRIEQKYYDLSVDGYRVLGIAYKKVRQEKSVYSINDESDMVFLGFVAFMDPPKQTARESLRLLAKTHIELKILTGDNEIVTRKTCDELGFKIKGVVLGTDVARMNDDALARVVEESNIFARVNPGQKDRIINALKANGHVVGFLGDGINDAPPMRVSDVSISVENAVDVAKETGDIILLSKDLTVLEQGVVEGRKTFGNSMKYIMMGVSSNFGNMFSAAGASLFLPFLPMLPTQILLNNLLYDLSELTIPTDSVDQEYLERPKRLNISFVRNYMLFFGPISSIFDFLTFFVMIFVFQPLLPPGLEFEGIFQTAWFIESLCTQTLVIFAIRTRMVPFYRSKPSRFLLLSSLSVVAAGIIIPYTIVSDWFKFVGPPLSFLGILAVFIVTYLGLVEVVKYFFYRRYGHVLEPTPTLKREVRQLTPTGRSVQDLIAIICLRVDDEIAVDSLAEDLKGNVTYVVDSEQVMNGLHHLRRMGVVEIDWEKNSVKRLPAMKEFVNGLSKGELWSSVADDWRRFGFLIQAKYGSVNPDYRRLWSREESVSSI
jgi:Mg2+-importing ATPase